MKRKASITALDDLYNTILKSSLLDSLDVKKSKSDPIAQLLEESGSEDDKDEEVEKSDKTPKIIEFSVTRMGKPKSSKASKSIKDLRKSLGGQFTEKEAERYKSSEDMHDLRKSLGGQFTEKEAERYLNKKRKRR